MWNPLTLTQSHRPQLVNEEQEIIIVPSVSIYIGETKTHLNGTAYLTTHRILWTSNEKQPTGLFLSLEDLDRTETKAGFFMSSPKIILYVKVGGPSNYCKLSFHKARHDEFAVKLDAARAQAKWKKAVVPGSSGDKKETKEFTPQAAGIAGIIRQVEKSHLDADRALSQAFSDLNALMNNAQEIVKMAERYSAERKERKDKVEKQEEEEFNSILLDMGIPSPVTRHSAGAAYHVQLSRQLADFLVKPLQQANGLLMLVDVWCLFNRARGTELISPDDLYHACNLFASLQLPLSLRKLSSGVLVVQSAQHNDEATSRRILHALRDKGPMTAPEISRLFSWSMILTTQHLEICEELEFICRDHTFEATRFYPNLFNPSLVS